MSLLYALDFVEISTTSESVLLAQEYVKRGILTQKSFDDCVHIAMAVINGIDAIVSWNFKHMVKYKTIDGVRLVNAEFGYFKVIDIVHPKVFLTEMEE